MIETIVVWTIVGAVGILAARSLYRTFTGEKNTCGCAGEMCSRNSVSQTASTDLYQIERTKE